MELGLVGMFLQGSGTSESIYLQPMRDVLAGPFKLDFGNPQVRTIIWHDPISQLGTYIMTLSITKNRDYRM